MKVLNVFLVLVLLAGVSFATEISACDYEITAPGYYNLTGDILAASASNCINITASDVELDCMGNTIWNYGGNNGIHISNDRVNITNCNIEYSATEAVYANGPDWITITDSTFQNNGGDGLYAYGSDYVTITGSTFQLNGDEGAEVSGQYLVIDNSHFDLNGDNGFDLDTGDDARITGSSFDGNDDYGVYIYDSADGYFSGNTFNNNVGQDGIFGLWVPDATFYDNEIDGNGDRGIELLGADGSTFELNTISNNANSGLYLNVAYYSLTTIGINIYNNTIHDNNNHGMELYDLEDCNIMDNEVHTNWFGSGIYIEGIDPSVISGNELYDNGISSGSYGLEVCDAVDTVFEHNVIYDNGAGMYVGGGGFLLYTDILPFNDANTIRNNNIYSNEGHGTEVRSLINSEIYENTFEGNGYTHYCPWGEGLYVDSGNTVYVHDNLAMDNYGNGMGFYGGDHLTVDDNELYGNIGSGIYLVGSVYSTLEGNDAYDHNSPYYYYYPAPPAGIWLDSVFDVMVEGGDLYNNYFGVLIFSTGPPSTSVTIRDIEIYNNQIYGIWAGGNGNTWVSGCNIYGNQGEGVYFAGEDSSGITDTSIHDNVGGVNLQSAIYTSFYNVDIYNNPGGYVDGLLMQNSDLYAEDVSIYSVDSPVMMQYSTLDAENLWIGHDENYGILYPILNTGFLMDSYLRPGNLILEQEFVSMDSTDPQTDGFRGPAILSTRVAGCTGLNYYYDTVDNLPTTTAEILANGATFTPASSACAGTKATYEVGGFSGYMALGSAPSSGGSSLDSMTITVSLNPVTGEELTITVKDSGNPLSNADVKVRVMVGGIYQYTDLGKTNAAGEVTFTPDESGNYRATAEKSGYHDEDKYFTVGTGEGMPECLTDQDCAIGYICVSGECTLDEEPPVEETPPGADTGPAGIECVSNMDCPEGYICEENLCIEDVIVEEPEGGPTDEDATQAIYEAEQAIDAAEKEGKDASTAKEYLVLAEQAYAAGDYQAAVDAANEAKTSAEHATVPAAAPTEPTTVPEVISEPVAPEEPPAEEGFPWIWVGLGVVIIAALAYWFFIRK